MAKKAGTSSGNHVPVQPRFENKINNGMIVVCGGRTIVEISTRNMMFLPGILKRANPYATMMHEINVPMVLITASRKVLRNSSR